MQVTEAVRADSSPVANGSPLGVIRETAMVSEDGTRMSYSTAQNPGLPMMVSTSSAGLTEMGVKASSAKT